MHKNAQVLPQSACSDKTLEAESFDNQLIKSYAIIKPTELLGDVVSLAREPPFNIYTHKAMEDSPCCFQESKHTVHGTKAKVYVDEFIFNCNSAPPRGSCIRLSLDLEQRAYLLFSWRLSSAILGYNGGSCLPLMWNATRWYISMC